MNHFARKAAVPSLIFFFLIAAALACNLGQATPTAATPTPSPAQLSDQKQASDIARLYQSSPITPTVELMNGGAVRFASFSANLPPNSGANNLARAQWFLNEYRSLIRLDDPAKELQYVRTSPDGGTLWFQQVHQGIPVHDAQLTIRIDGTTVRQIIGGYIPDINLSPAPRLTAQAAEAIALQQAGAKAQVLGGTQLRYLNLSLLGFKDKNTYLAWRVNLTNSDWASLFIDTDSGAVLYKEPSAVDEFELDLESGLHNTDSGCWDWTNNEKWFDEGGVYDAWGPDPVPDEEGHKAYANIKIAYEFYNYYGWDSYDNNPGGKHYIEMFIHVGGDVAQWKGSCQMMEFSDGRPVRDSVVHEYTHAVIQHTIGLGGSYQPGALAESLADIMAHMAATTNGDTNWLHAEDSSSATTPTGAGCQKAIRDLSNPPCFGDPDHMKNYVQVADGSAGKDNDKGWIHSNASIHSKAAYLLTEGGQFNGYDMKNGIGASKANGLYFNVIFSSGLVPSSDFMSARNAIVNCAKNLGNCGQSGFTYNDACIVQNAYAAVGLGTGDDPNCDGIKDGPPVPGDADKDGVLDSFDNCPQLPNGGQQDLDKDGQGNGCDDDKDGDGKYDAFDNCMVIANADQTDSSYPKDGQGDACDDTDGDGVTDAKDNCMYDKNAKQEDNDKDGKGGGSGLGGDLCDGDDDNDGIFDMQPDNCQFTANQGQNDWNKDGIGDACQDTDKDKLKDHVDNCPGVFTPDQDQSDMDKDLKGDACDEDRDGDTWNNDVDNAPDVANPGQEDDDKDKVGNVIDKCPALSDPDNSDYDGDGLGNPCDNDDDGDDVVDSKDNCPTAYNPKQHDANRNGVGTGCDPTEKPASMSSISPTTLDYILNFKADKITIIDLPPIQCPGCKDGMPDGFGVIVEATMDIGFKAGIMDSNGVTVSKNKMGNTMQIITFAPAVNAETTSGAAAPQPQAPSGPAPQSPSAPAPDRTRYFLVIYPMDGIDLRLSQKLHIEIFSGVSTVAKGGTVTPTPLTPITTTVTPPTRVVTSTITSTVVREITITPSAVPQIITRPPTNTPTNIPQIVTRPPTNTPQPPTRPPTNTPQPPTRPPTNTPQPPTRPPTNTPTRR